MPTLLKTIARDLSDFAFITKVTVAARQGIKGEDFPLFLDIGGSQRFDQWVAGDFLPASPKKRNEILEWIEIKLARLKRET